MKFILHARGTFEEVTAAFPDHFMANKFGVLHSYNPQETLRSKGVELDKNIRIFEICNPVKAKMLLEADQSFSMVLPCRVSIWEEADGSVRIGMISPGEVLESVMEGRELLVDIIPLVEELNNVTKKIIEDAAAA